MNERAQSIDAPSPGMGDGGTDVHYYFTVLKKRKWLMLAVTTMVLAAVVAGTARRPKIYEAIASVIMNPHAPRSLGGQSENVVELGSGNLWDNSEYYNTQFRILRSRSLAEEVVRRYRLQADPRVVPPPKGGVGGAVGDDRDEETRIDRATSFVLGSIRILPVKNSRVVGIGIRGRDPALCMQLANQLAAVYIAQNVAVKRDATEDATRFVAKQLDEARSELDRSETALYSYKKDENILSVALEDRQNMITKALEDFSTALTTTRQKRIELEARRNAIAGLLNDGAQGILRLPTSYVIEADGIALVRTRYREEQQKLDQLAQRYGDKHPEVLYQEQRVMSALTALAAEGQSLKSAIDAELKALGVAEGKYAAEVKRLTTEALDVNGKELAYRSRQRDATNASEVYTGLLKRLNDSGLQGKDEANNLRLLDTAQQPRSPVEPNLRTAGVLGLAGGLLFAFALAFFIELVDRTVKSQVDIEVTLGLPFLGFVPTLDDATATGKGEKQETYILRNPTSTVAECCRVLRTNLLFASADRPLKRLVVTSSNPVEGKTMTVVNLGIVMAQSGHRTLLVDTDMRRPRLHKAFGTSNENGVSRLIVGESDIDSAVKHTDVPGLFLLPCGPIPPNPAELLQTESFAALVEKLSEKFDRVIFDSPPVNAVTDAVVLSRVTDGTIFVVRANRTTRDAVARAKRLMQAVNTQIVGVVLNDVNLKNPHYANYYQYYHYKYHDAAVAPATAAVVAGGEPPQNG